MSDPVKAEQLRQMITIQRIDTTLDSYGQAGEAWVSFVTDIRSFIEPTGGSEFYAAQKVNAEATVNIWLRYNSAPSVDSAMRVVYGARYFDILSVMNTQEKNRWIRLVCKEVV